MAGIARSLEREFPEADRGFEISVVPDPAVLAEAGAREFARAAKLDVVACDRWRKLYQAAEDGLLPRWFEHKNKHGVPDYAMGFNVICSALLVLLGSPVRIYIISNGGYLLSCSLALAGYFVYRQLRPDVPRPFRLPTFAKWIALLVFVAWMAIYFFGGWNSFTSPAAFCRSSTALASSS